MRKYPVKNSFIIAAILLMVCGCGFKGNPIPYPMLAKNIKPVIKNMEAVPAQENIVLKWNFQDKSGIIHYIMIERSDIGQSGNICKDCPLIFKEIGRVNVKDSKLKDQEQSLSFTDSKVLKGHIYNYSLLLCEENANCSEAAKTEINFK
ncbi:MAG: hypothetical protein ABFD50_15345 [Smithella sp.]